MVEGWLDDEDGPQRGRKSRASAEDDSDDEGGESPPIVLCARCYSLKHYGCEYRHLPFNLLGFVV